MALPESVLTELLPRMRGALEQYASWRNGGQQGFTNSHGALIAGLGTIALESDRLQERIHHVRHQAANPGRADQLEALRQEALALATAILTALA